MKFVQTVHRGARMLLLASVFPALGSIAVLGVTAATPAAAADLGDRGYSKVPAIVARGYDWSGFYIGANAGWGSSHDTWSVDQTGADAGSHSSTGAVAGGQLGYRWQAGALVFGLEAQGNWADLKGSHVLNEDGTNAHSTLNAFGLFTGQVGYAWNNTLLYAKGGAAVTRTKYEVTYPGGADVSGNQTRWGAAVGAGLEYGFAPNWSVGVEYNHIFAKRFSTSFYDSAGFTDPDKVARVGGDSDLVTARLNYRWGGATSAKY
ncbi:outer membrane immunogenic protein [Rhodopseudomonas faecalis]|uniref:Outer membrane immunogenic protein n=2 Tax=Rhodopseudomonas faecalis TaxID=99655 RepID=A0A318THG1_9BRAD|nr:outer membrane immunogenic protein [Rhodopseudomonas faecalis]